MKNTAFQLCILILFGSCKTTFNKYGFTKEEYINSYKRAVLYGCLNESTEGGFQMFLQENKDLGIAPEVAVLLHSEILKAKTIGGNYSKKIKPINYEDYEGLKPIFSGCVAYSFSKEVDSIAKEKFRQLKKGELEYVNE